MNRFALALTLATLAATGIARADNPLIMDQFTADPTGRLFNGRIYLYPSHDMNDAKSARGGQGWFAMEDYHVFSTDNLLDWKDHGVILNQKDVPWVQGAANAMWAPDCVTKNGKYYFYFPASNRIGVAIADKPEGPFKVEPQSITGGIDPCCFIDPKDGKAYLVWAQGSIFVHKLNDDMKTLDPSVQTLRVPNLPTQGLIEGPFMFERKGIYYLTYPHAVRTAGFESEQLEYMIGDNPLGPFKIPPGAPPQPAAAPASAPAPSGLMPVIAPAAPAGPGGAPPATTTAPGGRRGGAGAGGRGGAGRGGAPGGGGPSPMGGIIMDQTANHCWTNHHSLVEYQGQWILFYHDKDLSPDFDKDRSVRADYITFNDDGSINKVIPTFRGVGICDAKRHIQVDRYSAVSKTGTAVSFLDDKNHGQGWKIALTEPEAFVQYDRVDFGKAAPKSIKVRASSDAGSAIEIRLDKNNGPLVAKVQIPKSADLTEVSVPLTAPATELHNLVITQPEKASTQIDWVSFE